MRQHITTPVTTVSPANAFTAYAEWCAATFATYRMPPLRRAASQRALAYRRERQAARHRPPPPPSSIPTPSRCHAAIDEEGSSWM